MIKTDSMLTKLVEQVRLLLKDIGGTSNLKEELFYYDASSLRQQFPTVEDLLIRLFDSWWNTARRQLLIRNKFHRLRQAVYEQGTHRLSSMSINDFQGWLINVFSADSAELSRKRNWKQFVDGAGAWACVKFIGQFPETTSFYNWMTTRVGIDCWNSARADWEKYANPSWQVAEEIAYRMPIPQTANNGIYGMGIVLVCDFLKEVGVDYYGKPDSQVKHVFEELGLIGKRQWERKTFDLFWRIAALIGQPPAVVDKIFWIAASARWDKTLDKNLDESNRREQQLHRKQRFSSLLNQFHRNN